MCCTNTPLWKGCYPLFDAALTWAGLRSLLLDFSWSTIQRARSIHLGQMCQQCFLWMKSRAYALAFETEIRKYLKEKEVWRANRMFSSLCVSDFSVWSLLRCLYTVGVSCWLLLEWLYMGIEGEKAPKQWKTVLVECHHAILNKKGVMTSSVYCSMFPFQFF